jgi:hypothetical protein
LGFSLASRVAMVRTAKRRRAGIFFMEDMV